MSERLLTWLLRLVGRAPLPLLHAIGSGVGLLFFIVPNRNRHTAIRNIERCFPELSRWQQWQLTRQHLQETGKALFEAPRLWFCSREALLAMVREVRGEEVLQQAIDNGRGVIGITLHLGSWELTGPYYSTRLAVTNLYRSPRYTLLGRMLREARGRLGATLVATDASGLKALYKTLREGGAIGLLPDQDPRDAGGVFAPFFNIPAYTMTLLPRLLAKSGATPVVIFAERLAWGRGFRIHYTALPAEVADRDPLVAATALNAVIEERVRIVPAQYQWGYKRFRTRPDGEERFYR